MSDNTAAPKRTVPMSYGFSVFRNEGDEISISQPDPFAQEETVVSIPLDHVDTLIQYLQEVRDEMRAESAGRIDTPAPATIRLT